MKNSSVWFGWIPILTKEILYDYSIFNLLKISNILEVEEKKRIDKILSKDGLYYRLVKESNDLSKDIVNIVVSLENNKVDNVLIFDEANQLKVHASCEIENSGLVKINLLLPKVTPYEKDIVEQCYIIIRDIYHSHTHHHKHEDLLLSLVKAKRKKEALNNIKKTLMSLPHTKVCGL